MHLCAFKLKSLTSHENTVPGHTERNDLICFLTSTLLCTAREHPLQEQSRCSAHTMHAPRHCTHTNKQTNKNKQEKKRLAPFFLSLLLCFYDSITLLCKLQENWKEKKRQWKHSSNYLKSNGRSLIWEVKKPDCTWYLKLSRKQTAISTFSSSPHPSNPSLYYSQQIQTFPPCSLCI